MTRDEIQATVIRLIKEELELDATAETRFEDLGMDSLDRIDLIFGIETALDVELDDDTTWDLPSVRAVVDHLDDLLGNMKVGFQTKEAAQADALRRGFEGNPAGGFTVTTCICGACDPSSEVMSACIRCERMVVEQGGSA